MMFKRKAGSTSNMIPLRVRDTSSTTGGYLSGLVYNTSGLTAKWRRQGDASWTSVTLASATAGTFTPGGFCQAGSGPSGAYEFHVPNAACASGSRYVEIELYGVTNMLPVAILIELDAVDYQDANAFGLANMPTGPLTVTGGRARANVEQILSTTLTNTPGNNPADRFSQFLDVAAASHKLTVANANQTGDGYAKVNDGTFGLAALKTLIDAIGVKTMNLPSDPADASDIAAALSVISGYIDTEITSIINSLSSLSTALANVPTTPAPTSSQNATAVRDELAVELARLDEDVSSRLASADYTAPDNAGIGDAVASASAAEIAADTAATSAASAATAAGTAASKATSADDKLTSSRMTALDDVSTMVAGDGTGAAKFTTSALSNAPAGGGGNGTTQVNLIVGDVLPRNVSGDIELFIGETTSTIITFRVPGTSTAKDLSGYGSLRLVIEAEKNSPLMTLEDDDLDRTNDATGQIGFVNDSSVTNNEGGLSYSLRVAATKEVVGTGKVRVLYAPGG